MINKYLLISNLALHKNSSKYKEGISWEDFRKKIESKLKNLLNYKNRNILIETIYAERMSSLDWENLFLGEYKGIIIGGSPYSVNDQINWINLEIIALKKYIKNYPDSSVLGVCFGHQLLGKIYGCSIVKDTKFFKGPVALKTNDNNFYVSSSCHGEYISEIPKKNNIEILAKGPHLMPYIVKYAPHVYGVQCHLEDKVACPLSTDYWRKFIKKVFVLN
jgi:GMP synthase-like glutamine amidotransferase